MSRKIRVELKRNNNGYFTYGNKYSIYNIRRILLRMRNVS